MVNRINNKHILNNHAEQSSTSTEGPIFTKCVTFNGHSNLEYENVTGERYYRNKTILICCTSSTNVTEYTSPDHATLSFSDNENVDGAAVDGGVFTVSAWFLYRAGGQFNGIIGKYDAYDGGQHGNPGNARREWALLVDNLNKLSFQLYDETNSAQLGVKYNTGLSANTWYHCAVTYDGRGERHAAVEGCKIYLNGSSVAVISGGYTDSPTSFRKTRKKEGPLYVGCWHPSDGDPHKSASYGGMYFLNGAIAEIAVWSRALTSAEVTNVYNNRRWDKSDVTDASHLWRFGNNFPSSPGDDKLMGGLSGSKPGINGGNPQDGNYIYDRIGTAHLYGNYYCSSSDITLSSSAAGSRTTSRPSHSDILAAANDRSGSLTWGTTINNDFTSIANGNVSSTTTLNPLFVNSPGIGKPRVGVTGSTSTLLGHGTSEITITSHGTVEAYKSTLGDS